MKKLLKLFVCASLLFVAQRAVADNCCGISNNGNNGGCCDCYCSSYFLPRSVGDNLVRQATYHNYEYGRTSYAGNFGLEYRHQASRKPSNIATALFGSNGIQFLGSSNLPASTTTTTTTCASSCNNTPTVVIADNFGLSPATNQTIYFKPKISYDIVDFQLFLGLDELCEGLFFQLNLPLAHTRWRLGTCGNGNSTTTTTTTTNIGCMSSCNNNTCGISCGSALPTPPTTPFNPGCMSTVYQTGVTPATFNPITPATSFADALSGNFLFGDMQTAWTAGRFNLGCAQSRTDLASVNMILGYNFWECPDYNVGVFIRAAAPMRSQDNCCSTSVLFSPKVGDPYWKLGAGLTGHAELYNCNDEHFINVYLEGYAEHMFSRCQVRSFDFANKGCLSRYMLLEEFNNNAGVYTYAGNLINAINFNTRSIRAHIAVQGEGILEFVYKNDCGFSAGLGYNIYGRSSEKGCNIGNPCDPTLNNRYFGIKGCAPVQTIGYQIASGVTCATTSDTLVTGGTGGTAGNPTYLNATQSTATMSACGTTTDNPQNLQLPCVPTGPGATAGVFYPSTCSFNVGTGTTANTVTISGAGAAGVAVASSTTAPTITATTGIITAGGPLTPDPVIIDPTATGVFNIQSGLAGSQITNKIFGHLDYAWKDCDWAPAVYVGGSVEFASQSRCAAMNAWDVFVGANVSF